MPSSAMAENDTPTRSKSVNSLFILLSVFVYCLSSRMCARVRMRTLIICHKLFPHQGCAHGLKLGVGHLHSNAAQLGISNLVGLILEDDAAIGEICNLGEI